MVAAILIPLIVMYFYFLSKKEMKQHFIEWNQLENFKEDGIVSGKITEVFENKERFYYHLYVHVQTLKIKTESKELIVKKVTPLKKDIIVIPFEIGCFYHLYGSWKNGHFHVNRAKKQ